MATTSLGTLCHLKIVHKNLMAQKGKISLSSFNIVDDIGEKGKSADVLKIIYSVLFLNPIQWWRIESQVTAEERSKHHSPLFSDWTERTS